MIGHAPDAGVRAAWVTRDEVYGGDPHLSADLERRQIGYVLAVSRKRPVPTHAGAFPAGVLAHGLPKNAWQQLSAGPGAKGHRFYDRAQVEITSPPDTPGHRWLLTLAMLAHAFRAVTAAIERATTTTNPSSAR